MILLKNLKISWFFKTIVFYLLGFFSFTSVARANRCSGQFNDSGKTQLVADLSSVKWLGTSVDYLSTPQLLELVLTHEYDLTETPEFNLIAKQHLISPEKIRNLRKLTNEPFSGGDDSRYLSELSKQFRGALGQKDGEVDLLKTFPTGLFLWLSRAEVVSSEVPESFFAKAYFSYLYSNLKAEMRPKYKPENLKKMAFGPSFYVEFFRLVSIKIRELKQEVSSVASTNVHDQLSSYGKAVLMGIANPQKLNNEDVELVTGILELFNKIVPAETMAHQTILELLATIYKPALKTLETRFAAKRDILEMFHSGSYFLRTILYPYRTSIFEEEYLRLQEVQHQLDEARTDRDSPVSEEEYNLVKEETDLLDNFHKFNDTIYEDIESADGPLIVAALPQFKIAASKLRKEDALSSILEAYIRFLNSYPDRLPFPMTVPLLSSTEIDRSTAREMVRRLLASESRTSRIFALLNWFGLFADSEMEPRLVEVVDEIFDLNIATTEVRQRIVQLATSFFVKNHHEKDRVPEDIYIRFFEKLRGYLITLDFDTMIPTEKDKFLHIVNIFCKKMSRSNSQSEHLRDLAEKILSVL